MVAVENACILVGASEEKERENAREGCAVKQALRKSRIEREGAVPLCEEGRRVFCLSHEEGELERSPTAEGSVRWRPIASAVSVCEQDGL